MSVITGGVVSAFDDGQVPHTGLCESVRAEFVENSSGSEVIFVTHQLLKSWSNWVAFKNICVMLVTLDVFQLPISWLNDSAAWNIWFMSITPEVSHPLISLLNPVLYMNICHISVTLEVSHSPISWLKLLAA